MAKLRVQGRNAAFAIHNTVQVCAGRCDVMDRLCVYVCVCVNMCACVCVCVCVCV